MKLANMECLCLTDDCISVNCSIRQVNRSVGVVCFNYILKREMADIEVSNYMQIFKKKGK